MQNTIVQGTGKCPKLPWMIEFHSTADGSMLNHQLKSAFALTNLEHLCLLEEKSKTRRKRLTQFAIVIPPQVSRQMLAALLKSGMTVAVFRTSFFSLQQISIAIELIKEVVDDFGRLIGRVYPLAIALELCDSEIVTGKLQKPLKQVELEEGGTTKIVTGPEYANRTSKDYIYVNNKDLPKIVKPGDSIILGNEKPESDIHLLTLDVVKEIIECIIERAGLLSDNLSVKIPNALIAPPSAISREELQDFKKTYDFDMIFVSPLTIEVAKHVWPSTVFMFLKVENVLTIESFEDTIDEIDGILFDGDKVMMGSKENVFIVQKSLIAKCNKSGKPIVSFINCNSITKAQVGDISNTIIDGADALLLPPDTILMENISLICKSAEGAIYQKQLFDNMVLLKPPPIEPVESIAIASVTASFQSNAAAIILITTSGRSARLVSKYKPRCPIIALTRIGRVAKHLMIYKGIIPIFYVERENETLEQTMEKKMQLGMTFGKVNGYIRMGDAVVIMFGIKNRIGFRNCLEVVFASEYDTIPESQNRFDIK